MNLMTFYMYCLDRLGWTIMLARATSYTSFFVDCRNKKRILILWILHDQTDGSHGTVSGTSQTFYVVGVYDAQVRIDDCMAYLN